MNPWPSDAVQIDIKDIKKVMFKNSVVEEFLNNSRKHFVSANKGLGKTLLLTYKRYHLFNEYNAGKSLDSLPNVHFIPEGSPYLDLMTDINDCSKPHEQFLSSLKNTKRIWSFAIKLSAISHFPNLLKNKNHDWDFLPESFYEMLKTEKLSPTMIFKETLHWPVSKIFQIFKASENFLEIKFRSITSGIFIFIDKVDQSTQHFEKEGWIQTQAGLIEAAWDIMNTNRHVKIYGAIRHEAFSNYESPIKANLTGATTVIKYTIRDLRELLDRLSQCYENGNSFKEFIGFDTLRNGMHGCVEDSFEYTFRHTVGTPRDLVIICSKLHDLTPHLTESEFRDSVNKTSSEELIKNVFNEMGVFLNCLKKKSNRAKFFSLITQNILKMEELINICAAFNEGIAPDAFLPLMNEQGDCFNHPFFELYNAGLLGVVSFDPVTEKNVQRFKQPYDILSEGNQDLPKGDFYLIHPSLHYLIQKHSQENTYHIFKYMVIGHGYEWKEHYPSLVNAQKTVSQITNEESRKDIESTFKEIISSFLENPSDEEHILSQEQQKRFMAIKSALKDPAHSPALKAFQELEKALLPQPA
ncbi:MAG: hypothetical protein OEZ05_10065 [Nitrospirota bacterium]|nr:hypothetical protein [Nitrospirota bacterium]